MRLDDLLGRVTEALAGPLPGAAGQWLMAPRPPRDWPEGFEIARVRHAAGLLLLFARDGRAHVVLTERAHTLGRHRGQISLAGGVIEPEETVIAAALREAHEEIGLDPATIQVLGLLTPVDIPVSGFRLHPVVATTPTPPLYQPASDEVERVLEVDVEELLSAERIVWRTLQRDQRPIEFPAFAIHDVEIWGATAMVLAELLAMLGWNGPARDTA